MTANSNTPQDYLNFLMETLQKVAEDDNPQVIYPFLEKNLDKLDDNLIKVLDNWAKNKLSSVNTDQAYSIAVDIVNFSNLIQEFSLAIAINKEIAITGYKIALTVFTFEKFTKKWAIANFILAVTYFNRIRGDKADNIENAITHYTKALRVFTFDKFPQDWARTRNYIANAYLDRIRGDKADNIENAIAHYTEALKVFTFDEFPQDWAEIQNNLAIAYSYRVKGDKAENLEQAISYHTKALKVRTFDKFPQDWADTINNIAISYYYRIRDDKAENLEQAISYYTEALKGFFRTNYAKLLAIRFVNLL